MKSDVMKLCILALLFLGSAAQVSDYWVEGPCPQDEVDMGCPLNPTAQCSFICWKDQDKVECMYQHFLNNERVGCWA